MGFPKLSEDLAGQRDIGICQSCGSQFYGDINYWVEHDDNDLPTQTVVLLCDDCEKKLVKPHPRLYSRTNQWKPRPGSMPNLCATCRYRHELSCKSPNLIENGGDGLRIDFPKPGLMHVNYGGGRGEWVEEYSPPTRCAGRSPVYINGAREDE